MSYKDKAKEAIYQRNYFLNNKDQYKASSKRWYMKNIEAQRLKYRKRHWKGLGFDIDKAEALRASCDRCQLCGKIDKVLHVDHCHKTKKLRGILCISCNTGLGNFKDNPALIRKAADYVEFFT